MEPEQEVGQKKIMPQTTTENLTFEVEDLGEGIIGDPYDDLHREVSWENLLLVSPRQALQATKYREYWNVNFDWAALGLLAGNQLEQKFIVHDFADNIVLYKEMVGLGTDMIIRHCPCFVCNLFRIFGKHPKYHCRLEDKKFETEIIKLAYRFFDTDARRDGALFEFRDVYHNEMTIDQ